MKQLIFVFLLSVVFFISCNKSSNPTSSNTSNSGGTVPTTVNTMDVTTDGSSHTGWAAQGSRSSSNGITVVSVTAFDLSGKSLTFTLTNIPTTGTYDVGILGYLSSTFRGVTMTYTTKDASGSILVYSTPPADTTSVGKINISEITATSVKATFNATLSLQKGSGPSTTAITNGGVNATIK